MLFLATEGRRQHVFWNEKFSMPRLSASPLLLRFYHRSHEVNRFWQHRNQLQGAQWSTEVPQSTCSFSLSVPEKTLKKFPATTSFSTHQGTGTAPWGKLHPGAHTGPEAQPPTARDSPQHPPKFARSRNKWKAELPCSERCFLG